MSAIIRVRELLDQNHVKYIIIIHSPAFTAQEIASLSFISGKELAKSVILNVNGDVVMAVVPASERVDLAKLKTFFGIQDISLAEESEFRNIFPECKTGAMPPLGNLYQLKTYISTDLKKNKYITFNAGSHSELIRMKYSCYEKIVQPVEVSITIN
ncbi:MAG: YbaK/EbsC family protein [Candidatus Marinimicrobia bacterium]|nr:YbaK/EbsC family protein [Candidatus Neomarinimicrobiota bacterium]